MKFIVALLALFTLSSASAAEPERSGDSGGKKPNILIILADDLGYGDVRCYNDQSKVATPHLDRLAREGMLFTDAHSPCTVCTPTRYSLLTGQMAFRVPRGGTVFTGAGGPSLIAAGRLTLAAMLKQQGYSTAAIGKWHVGLTFRDAEGKPIHESGLEAVRRIDFSRRIEGGPLDHGFDRFFGTACCPTTDWLYAFMDGDRIPAPPTGPLQRDMLPKHPYADDCRQGLIAPDYPMQEVDMLFLQKSREFIAEHARTSPQKPFFLYHATQAVHLPSFAGKDFRGETQAGPHGDFIAEFDHIVGELMKELDRHGLADNTLVILSSDNGPETTAVVHMRADYGHDGAKPWRGVKRDAWEGGHRVPFIVRWPSRIKASTTCDQLACLTDVMATVAAITGAKLPENAAEDSFNLLPALEGKAASPIRPYLISQAFSGVRTLSIRRGNWKYIAHPSSGGNNYDKGEMAPFALPDTAPGTPGQLYDIATDPGETKNLHAERPDIVQELKALLEESKASGRSRPALPMSSKVGAAIPRPPREVRDVSGWQVHIQNKLLESEPADTDHALVLLKQMLDAIVRDVPAPAVAELRKVPLYFSSAYKPGQSGAEFHPDAGWLRENGRDPVMARGVEFSGVHDFEAEMKRMPNFALHELAHAYHHRVLKGGFDNTEIKAAYERAKAAGKYERVERWHGNGRPNTFERAYAMTNPMEYFAETTEAFFSRNDFFPFTRDELKQHDPEMFVLLARLWGVPAAR